MSQSIQPIVDVIDNALALAPGTRQEHEDRRKSLQLVINQMKWMQDRIKELEAALEAKELESRAPDIKKAMEPENAEA